MVDYSPWGCKELDTTEQLHFQTVVEVTKIIVTFLKRSQPCTGTVHAPNPAISHHQPMPLPETPRLPQASLLCSHCSFLLGPSAQCAIVPSKSISQSYISSGSSTVGLMATSSKSDRDLGLHSILTRGVRPHLEGKQRTPRSSRVATCISWSPLSGLRSVGEL